MKPIWNGAIGFGLVNIPVKLYSATESSTLDLDMLDKKDLSIQDFTIRNALDRIAKKGDILSPASSLLITTTQPSGWFSSPRRIQATMLLWSK
jgi:hypothetical protein